VASGSFSTGEVTVPRQGQPPRGGAVINTSFDAAAETAPSTTTRTTGSVKRGGFGSGEAVAAQPRQRTRPVEKPDTPVAIVSKPKPVYTEQARELRIEGEVVLEVTFPASGRLRVLRVLGGLGYGLDEAAIEAAEKIEFEPARRGGRPVDHTATLRVVVQLA
jgi:TonB family protein